MTSSPYRVRRSRNPFSRTNGDLLFAYAGGQREQLLVAVMQPVEGASQGDLSGTGHGGYAWVHKWKEKAERLLR